MIWKPIFMLLSHLRGRTRIPAVAALTTNAVKQRPGTLDELAARLLPKIREEVRHRPGALALDSGARQAAMTTAGMLLESHIAELKTDLEAKRAEAAQLRLIASSTELGVKARHLLAQHRGEA